MHDMTMNSSLCVLLQSLQIRACVQRTIIALIIFFHLSLPCATIQRNDQLPEPLKFYDERLVVASADNVTGKGEIIFRESKGKFACSSMSECRKRPLLWRVREMLPPEQARSFLSFLKDDELFNKDADSVDGKPTDEIVLLRDGRLLPSTKTGVVPLLWYAQKVFEQVNFYVREKLRCPTCEVCTSLVRKYGTDSLRQGVLVHFDEKALATAIISLDHSRDYDGGLVVQQSPLSRRLATLEQGDMILHSYDLLHGVDVRRGSRRSLIMWISSDPTSCKDRSLRWKHHAARQGNAHAQSQLGRSQIFGEVPGGRKNGWRWIRRAAQQGLPTALLNLGLREMEQGKVHRARRLWTRAAQQGNELAAYNLGVLFLSRDGKVDPNQKRGMKWLRNAAELGNMEAAEVLAGCLVYKPPCAG